jgi:mRNA-degrading endonuclease toxin of MazEF toxin-antitoxin module
MPTTSFLIAENTLSAEKTFLTERITELSEAKMGVVCRALTTATSCN